MGRKVIQAIVHEVVATRNPVLAAVLALGQHIPAGISVLLHDRPAQSRSSSECETVGFQTTGLRGCAWWTVLTQTARVSVQDVICLHVAQEVEIASWSDLGCSGQLLDELPADILSHAQAPQVVEERSTLGCVAVKYDDIVLGPCQSCVQILQLFTEQHIMLVCRPGSPESPLVNWIHLHLHTTHVADACRLPAWTSSSLFPGVVSCADRKSLPAHVYYCTQKLVLDHSSCQVASNAVKTCPVCSAVPVQTANAQEEGTAAPDDCT